MIIPPDTLQPETLRSLIKEFILREGTNYGLKEYTLEEKVAQIQKQLNRKEVFIVFDPEEETFNIVSKDA